MKKVTKKSVKSKHKKSKNNKLFVIGEQYFIRTVNYHALGVLEKEIDGFIFLKDASWVADSGRFSNALKEGIEKQSNSELEPFPNGVYINIKSIVDFCIYQPKIILIQK